MPPAKFVFDEDGRRGTAIDSMCAGGCIVSGATVRHSLLFSNVVAEQGSLIQDSVVLPDVRVGRNCEIRRAVIDTGCTIPDGVTIGLDAAADARRFAVSEQGVVLVTPEMLRQEWINVR